MAPKLFRKHTLYMHYKYLIQNYFTTTNRELPLTKSCQHYSRWFQSCTSSLSGLYCKASTFSVAVQTDIFQLQHAEPASRKKPAYCTFWWMAAMVCARACCGVTWQFTTQHMYN